MAERRDWRVLGAEMRHPAYEPETARPAPLRAPPPERNITPWPPVVRVPRVPPPMPPPPRASVFPRTGPQWAVGIATVITALGTALGGMSYMFSQYRKDAAADTVEAATKVNARLAAIDGAMRTMLEDQQARDIVQLAVLCTLNNGSPARSVRCPPNACEPVVTMPDGKPAPGQPLCRATVDWPPVRRSP